MVNRLWDSFQKECDHLWQMILCVVYLQAKQYAKGFCNHSHCGGSMSLVCHHGAHGLAPYCDVTGLEVNCVTTFRPRADRVEASTAFIDQNQHERATELDQPKRAVSWGVFRSHTALNIPPAAPRRRVVTQCCQGRGNRWQWRKQYATVTAQHRTTYCTLQLGEPLWPQPSQLFVLSPVNLQAIFGQNYVAQNKPASPSRLFLIHGYICDSCYLCIAVGNIKISKKNTWHRVSCLRVYDNRCPVIQVFNMSVDSNVMPSIMCIQGSYQYPLYEWRDVSNPVRPSPTPNHSFEFEINCRLDVANNGYIAFTMELSVWRRVEMWSHAKGRSEVVEK